MLALLDYSRFAVTVFSILNPFAAIPLFLMLTEGRSHAYTGRTARTAGIAVFVILMVAALTGDALLRLIGASLPAFQVAGGIILFLMALSMVNAQLSPQQHTAEERAEANERDAIGVVPLAMPLLVGPGSISATIIMVREGAGWWHHLIVFAILGVICILVWLVLRAAVPIGRRLGRTGLNILNRIFGLLLAALAVQIFANGVRGLFPASVGA